MRTVTAATQTAISGPASHTIYLIELGFSQPLRLSTREQLTWAGQVWQRTGARLGSIQAEQAEIDLANHDYAAGALVLTEGVKDKPVVIYQLSGPGPWATDDAEELFRGVMDDVPQITERVRIRCTRQSISTTTSPRDVVAPPICNHLVPPGTTIGNVILEAR
jgi:hypothetical protein